MGRRWVSRDWRTVLWVGAVAGSWVAAQNCGVAAAGEPGDAAKRAEAERLVNEGLHFGALGDLAERQRLIDAALEVDADYAPAHWAQGSVQIGRDWIDSNQGADLLKDDAKLTRYRFQRDQATDTLQSQWDLAEWCLENRLPNQAKAHLNRVIQLEPNHAAARQALGYQRINGRWVSPEMVADANERATSDLVDLQQFDGAVRRLADRLSSSSAAVRKQAAIDLAEITDARAAVAVEAILASHSEAAALAGVEALERWQEQRATEALARQSIVSPWPAVRGAAAVALKGRDEIDYVPALLAEFQMPVSVQVQAVPLAPNRLLYREVLMTEDQSQCNCMVRDTALRRLSMPGGQANQTAARMMNDMMGARQQTQGDASQINDQLSQRNAAIAQTLRTATGEDLENDPRTWWNWWNDENGIQVTSKEVQVDYQVQERSYTDQVPSSSGGSSGATAAPTQMPHECLAAGTIVLTDRGEVAIEQVQVGDLVLSQEAESGRVEFRPVLRTTVRNPTQLVEFRIGDEWIRASSGHPFWVAGEGWRLAQELEAGMMLHAERTTLPIVEVRTGDTEETYNLVVDGFATYFVGKQRVLGHDATNRRPSRELVPGLSP